jgi:hypothetical protein
MGKSEVACSAKNCPLARDLKKPCAPAKLVCEKRAAVSAGEASSKDTDFWFVQETKKRKNRIVNE